MIFSQTKWSSIYFLRNCFAHDACVADSCTIQNQTVSCSLFPQTNGLINYIVHKSCTCVVWIASLHLEPIKGSSVLLLPGISISCNWCFSNAFDVLPPSSPRKWGQAKDSSDLHALCILCSLAQLPSMLSLLLTRQPSLDKTKGKLMLSWLKRKKQCTCGL